MKNVVSCSAIAGAAAAAMISFSPAQAGVVGPMSSAVKTDPSASLIEEVRRGRRWRRRGIGIGAGLVTLGVIGAIAASRAHSRPYYYDRGYRYRRSWARTCRIWRRRCYNGNDRACWKFDTRC